MKKQSPCKHCKMRTATCHSTCRDYKTWRADMDSDNAIIRKGKTQDAVWREYKTEIVSKTREGKRR